MHKLFHPTPDRVQAGTSKLLAGLRQVGPRLVSLEEAMAASGLHKSETFWDQASDTKMLLAYSRTMLICVFRGTGSWRNARSDIQVRLCCVGPAVAACWAHARCPACLAA